MTPNPFFLSCAPLRLKRLVFVFEVALAFLAHRGGFRSDFEHTFAAVAQPFEN
jgi:hypothetical protein